MARFIHTADWQLGMTRAFLTDEGQALFSRARLDAITTIGQAAKAANAEFILVCGDVYDDNRVDPKTAARSLDALRNVPVHVYLLPGNHDSYDPGSIYRSKAFLEHKPPHVQVLTDAGTVEVRPGLEIVAAPFPTRKPAPNPATPALKGLETAPPGTVRILAAHGGMDVTSPDPDRADLLHLDELEAALADGRIHYAALGDHHSHVAIGATGRIRYSGAPEPADYDEQNPGKALLVELDPSACRATEISIGKWRFRREARDLAGDQDLEPLAVHLDGVADKSTTILKLGLVGTLTLRGSAKLDEILTHVRTVYGGYQDWEREKSIVLAPDAADLDALHLSGFAQVAMEELRATANAGGADARTAKDAISLLWRLSHEGEPTP